MIVCPTTHPHGTFAQTKTYNYNYRYILFFCTQEILYCNDFFYTAKFIILWPEAVIWVNHLTCMMTVVGDLRHDTFEKKVIDIHSKMKTE